jgi:glycine cleavage system H protein
VTGRNERLGEQPELINTDPYGDGWLVEIEPESATDVDALLDADGYRRLTEG